MIARATLLLAIVSATAALGATSPSTVMRWPTRPIRLIVTFPPGSSTDTAARVIAAKLSDALGQPIVIDNRGGASGNIGTEAAARSAPDGHTLVVGTTSTLAVAPSVNPRLGYDPIKDFAPVSMIASSPYVIAVHPAVPAGNARGFRR